MNIGKPMYAQLTYRESLRDSVPASARGQALSHGHPRQRSPQHLGQCERGGATDAPTPT